MATIGAVISPMARTRGVAGVAVGSFSMCALDGLDHDDGVVDDDADGQHQRRAARACWRRSPSASITAKVPISETGTAISGISVARTAPRNRKTTRTTRTKASSSVSTTSWMLSSTNRRGVVGDLEVDALRESRCDSFCMSCADAPIGRGEGVAARRLVDAEHGRGRAVVAGRSARALCGAEFDAGDVANGARTSRRAPPA